MILKSVYPIEEFPSNLEKLKGFQIFYEKMIENRQIIYSALLHKY